MMIPCMRPCLVCTSMGQAARGLPTHALLMRHAPPHVCMVLAVAAGCMQAQHSVRSCSPPLGMGAGLPLLEACASLSHSSNCNTPTLIAAKVVMLALARTGIPGFSSDIDCIEQQLMIKLGPCDYNFASKLSIATRPIALRAFVWCCALQVSTQDTLGFLVALRILAEVRERHAGGSAGACGPS